MGILSDLFDSPPELRKAQEVKALIDRNFTYQSDMDKWGVEHKAEWWTGDVPISADCEEYAFGSSTQMRRSGFPYSWKVVTTRSGQGHMVACGPQYCIDNLQPQPYEKGKLGLLYILKGGSHESGSDKN